MKSYKEKYIVFIDLSNSLKNEKSLESRYRRRRIRKCHGNNMHAVVAMQKNCFLNVG
jgi:hypothetical protein